MQNRHNIRNRKQREVNYLMTRVIGVSLSAVF